jgi:hypothetical protein
VVAAIAGLLGASESAIRLMMSLLTGKYTRFLWLTSALQGFRSDRWINSLSFIDIYSAASTSTVDRMILIKHVVKTNLYLTC